MFWQKQPAIINSSSVTYTDKSKLCTMSHGDSIVTHVPPRKKATGVRTWLLLDSMGQNQVIEAGKHYIMRRTSLPARDLRVLDPFLSYPSTVFGRERAIVISLEHIKAIIMAKEVLLLNSKDPFVQPLVLELEKRILCYHQLTKDQGQSEDDSRWINKGELRQQLGSSKELLEDFSESQENGRNEEKKHAFKNQDGGVSNVLPFEFIALEACLEATCTSLDNEAKTLELEAYPALDKLTSKISTLNLERVRQIKSRLVDIIGRVQRVRDELEHLLEDDGDMSEMDLTNKLSLQHLEESSTSSTYEGNENEAFVYGLADTIDRIVPPEILPEAYKASTSCQRPDIENNDNGKAKNILFSAPNETGRDSQRSDGSLEIKDSDVGELEMLLEAYFIQIEGTLNRLSTLREYVNDTEDYINIMLDEKQNQLLQMGVTLTTATLILTIAIVVAGVLGMNIRVHLFKMDVQQEMPKWLWTTGSCTIGIILLYIMAISFYKHQGFI